MVEGPCDIVANTKKRAWAGKKESMPQLDRKSHEMESMAKMHAWITTFFQ